MFRTMQSGLNTSKNVVLIASRHETCKQELIHYTTNIYLKLHTKIQFLSNKWCNIMYLDNCCI